MVYGKGTAEVIISRDVVFKETEMFYQRQVTDKQPDKQNEVEDVQFEVESPAQSVEMGCTGTDMNNESQEDHVALSDDDVQEEYLLARDRERRCIKAPSRFGYADMVAFALTAAEEIDGEEPKTYSEAVNSKESHNWLDAMNDELDSLHKNNTWELAKGKETSQLQMVVQDQGGNSWSRESQVQG